MLMLSLETHHQESILKWRYFVDIHMSIYCLMFTTRVQHSAELIPDCLPSESGQSIEAIWLHKLHTFNGIIVECL